jgi:hypothetical protein
MEAYVVRRAGAPIESEMIATSSLAEKETSRMRVTTPAKAAR